MIALGWPLYRAASLALSLAAGPWLAHRARIGKEDPARLHERFGRAAVPRPDGPLVWMHGASVGESGVLATLWRRIAAERSDLRGLVTTHTRTAAALAPARFGDRVVHQFAPLDTPGAAARFLDHWRPDLAIFAESELWPNLLLGLERRGIPAALVNARMNARSRAAWARWRATALRLLSTFDVIGAADVVTAESLGQVLGRAVPMIGNLKAAATAPGADPADLALWRAALADRPVWLAASTHPGEDEVMLAAHARLRAGTGRDWLLLLAPRHPERGDAIARLAADAGAAVSRRALDRAPPGPETSVLVADTLGEMGLWLRLAAAVFVAGSLRSDLSGHTPIEAAQLGAPILTGPHVASFADLYAELLDAGGARTAATADEIARTVADLTAAAADAQRRAAAAVAARHRDSLDTTIERLRPLLPSESAHARP